MRADDVPQIQMVTETCEGSDDVQAVVTWPLVTERAGTLARTLESPALTFTLLTC